MSFIEGHLLTAIVFLPLLGALVLLAFPRGEASGARGFSLTVALVDLALVAWMWARLEPSSPNMQLVEQAAWVPSLGISYALGVDGLSVLLVVLTAFLAPLVIISTYSSVTDRIRDHMICLLALQTGMLGSFVATDLLLFYVFWEVMLVPMYFLIGMWGGRRRIYATIKFFIYTMAGSLLMLVAILFTVWAVRNDGGLTFSLTEVTSRLGRTDLGPAEAWLFLGFALAFAIKVPMFPFHTWLPDAHVEAPTSGSVILAGVLLKLGTYGFLRYALWMFPRAATQFLPALGILAVVGIIYGALVAMVQTDLKRLVAYSSVSHLGFVMLGLCAMTVAGISGGVLQMVNHGISTGALFLLVGVIYERRHTRLLDDFGGLARVMPRYATLFVIIALSSIGLPGLNGFVGEFLILAGSFASTGAPVRAEVGELAWAGIIAAEIAALVAVILVASAVFGRGVRQQFGRKTRVAAVVAVTVLCALLVAPPLGGFAGGLLIRPLVLATGRSEAFRDLFALLAVLATTGVILAAVYMLLAVQRVFFGPVRDSENARLSDLSLRESTVLVPLGLLAIGIGLYPEPLLRAIEPTAISYAREFRARSGLPVIAARGPEAESTREATLDGPARARSLPALPDAQALGHHRLVTHPQVASEAPPTWMRNLEQMRQRRAKRDGQAWPQAAEPAVGARSKGPAPLPARGEGGSPR